MPDLDGPTCPICGGLLGCCACSLPPSQTKDHQPQKRDFQIKNKGKYKGILIELFVIVISVAVVLLIFWLIFRVK